MRNLRRHANAFAQRGVWVNRFTNIHRIRAHLNRQRNLADHVTRVGADHAAAKNLAVAVGFRRIVKQQFGNAFVAAVRNGAA